MDYSKDRVTGDENKNISEFLDDCINKGKVDELKN